MKIEKQRQMTLEYQDIIDVQEFILLTENMPFARIGNRLVNTARLVGREAERNATNIVGQGTKVVQATADTLNPFVSLNKMKEKANEMDKKIFDRLKQVDARYADAIAALWQSVQLTDFQAFLFMLNPAVYLGAKTLPQAMGFAVNALATASGQTNSPIAMAASRATSAMNTVTTAGGPGANQDASMSGGGYGGGGYGGDFGGDYGGDY